MQEWLFSNEEVKERYQGICKEIEAKLEEITTKERGNEDVRVRLQDGSSKEKRGRDEREGVRVVVNIGVCCQLGKHRSVAMVETLGRKRWPGWDVEVEHRDAFMEKTKAGREKERRKARDGAPRHSEIQGGGY